MLHSGFEGDVVAYVLPLHLKEMKFKTTTSVGYKLSQELDDEDNPVLVVYKEK